MINTEQEQEQDHATHHQQITSALAARAWPFVEARKLITRFQRTGLPKKVLFSTGYSPSGVPHIGTFCEVLRTRAVKHAFELLAQNIWTREEISTQLICFSDDMDGLRKVPDNIPQRQLIAKSLGVTLTKVPDPFGTHSSFAAHNNARLRSFLGTLGFEYSFKSSTEHYSTGLFDEGLLRMLEVFDDVMDIMLPSLGKERRATYSPFMPVVEETGEVLQVPTLECNVKQGTIVYLNPGTGKKIETPVTGGRVKCQWKPDWALRWFALGIHYEMAGKDLSESVTLAARICRALGRPAPEGFCYELFLDGQGKRISKSIGNGLAVEEWLRYAIPESLGLFMYQKPKTAKRLWFDVIPKSVNDYYSLLKSYHGQDITQRLENPVWHIHAGDPPKREMPLSFGLLLNLVSVANASEPHVLWGFITRYLPASSPAKYPDVDRLVNYAICYYHDFIKPTKRYRKPDDRERAALEDLLNALGSYKSKSAPDGEAIQNTLYAIGKSHGFEPLREWFSALYQILLGQDQGPRFGSFIALYGVKETCNLIEDALIL